MATKKTKKNVKNISIKARDLKPAKDAKGGRKHHHRRSQTPVETVNDGGWGPGGAGKWDY